MVITTLDLAPIGPLIAPVGFKFSSVLMLVGLCTVRIQVALMVLPATSDTTITGVVRNSLAVSLGLFVAAGQSATFLDSLSTVHLLALVLKEAFIGMLLGIAAGAIFWIAEGVGMLIDNQAGYNNVQQTNPLSGQSSTPVGNLLLQLAVTGFFMLGGLAVFAGLLLDSFFWWPLGSASPNWQHLLYRFLPDQLRSYSETLIKLAGPILIMMVIIDLGIGLLGKAAEKLEPGSLGQPIKGAMAMLMVALLVTVFFQQAAPTLSMQLLKKAIESQVLGPQPPNP